MKVKSKGYHMAFAYKTAAALMRVMDHGDNHDGRFPHIPDLGLRYK